MGFPGFDAWFRAFGGNCIDFRQSGADAVWCFCPQQITHDSNPCVSVSHWWDWHITVKLAIAVNPTASSQRYFRHGHHFFVINNFAVTNKLTHICISWHWHCILTLYVQSSLIISVRQLMMHCNGLRCRVKASLAKAESTFLFRCQRRFHNPPPLTPLRHNAPWLHIVVACIEFALSTLDPSAVVMHQPISDDVYAANTTLPIGNGWLRLHSCIFMSY